MLEVSQCDQWRRRGDGDGDRHRCGDGGAVDGLASAGTRCRGHGGRSRGGDRGFLVGERRLPRPGPDPAAGGSECVDVRAEGFARPGCRAARATPGRPRTVGVPGAFPRTRDDAGLASGHGRPGPDQCPRSGGVRPADRRWGRGPDARGSLRGRVHRPRVGDGVPRRTRVGSRPRDGGRGGAARRPRDTGADPLGEGDDGLPDGRPALHRAGTFRERARRLGPRAWRPAARLGRRHRGEARTRPRGRPRDGGAAQR